MVMRLYSWRKVHVTAMELNKVITYLICVCVIGYLTERTCGGANVWGGSKFCVIVCLKSEQFLRSCFSIIESTSLTLYGDHRITVAVKGVKLLNTKLQTCSKRYMNHSCMLKVTRLWRETS
jgi:hypothetical protein